MQPQLLHWSGPACLCWMAGCVYCCSECLCSGLTQLQLQLRARLLGSHCSLRRQESPGLIKDTGQEASGLVPGVQKKKKKKRKRPRLLPSWTPLCWGTSFLFSQPLPVCSLLCSEDVVARIRTCYGDTRQAAGDRCAPARPRHALVGAHVGGAQRGDGEGAVGQRQAGQRGGVQRLASEAPGQRGRGGGRRAAQTHGRAAALDHGRRLREEIWRRSCRKHHTVRPIARKSS